jgi:ATP-dependent RNA helicase DDX31/DBP7
MAAHLRGLSREPLDTLPVCQRLRDTLQQKLSIETLTRIQSESIPMLLSGRDTLVQSQTGSGKTLCYLVPLLEKLQAHAPRVAREAGTRALVLLPTRELCTQVLEVLQKVVTPFHWLVTGSLMGGEKKKAEKARLRKGVPIIVATPGRLVDHLKNTECFVYKHLEWLVLDEADRLLDLGFEKDLTYVVTKLREATRGFQTVLASATLTEGVERLAQVSLVDPLRAGYGDGDGGGGDDAAAAAAAAERVQQELVPSTLTQSYLTVDSRNRLSTLCALLRCKVHLGGRKVLVFLSTCDSVDFHYELFRSCSVPTELGGTNQLTAKLAEACGLGGGAFGGQKRKPRTAAEKRKGIDGKLKKPKAAKGKPAGGGGSSSGAGDDDDGDGLDLLVGGGRDPSQVVFKLHGNMAQKDRAASFSGFSSSLSGSGGGSVLFCTDVAARGLDIKGVDWIIQYDPPNEPADYIHRIGRTARAGRGGDALLFLQQSEESYIELLELKGLRMHKHGGSGGMGSGGMDFFLEAFPPHGMDQPHRDPRLIEMALQRHFESLVLEDEAMAMLAATAWQAFLRAYQTHCKESRKAFQVKKLHLGHVAKSFGLKETPSRVANKAKEVAAMGKGKARGQAIAAAAAAAASGGGGGGGSGSGVGSRTWREDGVGLDKKIGKGAKAFKKTLATAKRKVRAEGGGIVENGRLVDGPNKGGSAKRRKGRSKIMTTEYSGEFAG